ncbi:YppE family protein [Mesobacillus harenae]|uniref:YppE family protein n=1 Tax=Mesobacillus harenae TaxID=2213203 RepID=UPI0015811AB6|nr:YppE family protein [Mesobacillus harenae]
MAQYIKKSADRFELVKQTGSKSDFYTEVKPFADEVKGKVEVWKEEALVWVTEVRPKNLHSMQISTTADNIEMVSIQAFFPETSRKRFIDHIQAINYVLIGILNSFNK